VEVDHGFFLMKFGGGEVSQKEESPWEDHEDHVLVLERREPQEEEGSMKGLEYCKEETLYPARMRLCILYLRLPAAAPFWWWLVYFVSEVSGWVVLLGRGLRHFYLLWIH